MMRRGVRRSIDFGEGVVESPLTVLSILLLGLLALLLLLGQGSAGIDTAQVGLVGFSLALYEVVQSAVAKDGASVFGWIKRLKEVCLKFRQKKGKSSYLVSFIFSCKRVEFIEMVMMFEFLGISKGTLPHDLIEYQS